MSRKVLPLHIRLGYIKNPFQSWYSDHSYSNLWFKDFRLRKFLTPLNQRGSIYALARSKLKRKNKKSFWTIGGVWSKMSFYKIFSHSFLHALPKIGPQAFYSPFTRKKKRFQRIKNKKNYLNNRTFRR